MRTEKGFSLKFYILIFTLIFSCAGFSQDSEAVDPLEDLNRKFYIFNFEVVDPLLLEPLARSYEKLTPNFTKKLVNNFFSNLDDYFEITKTKSLNIQTHKKRIPY